VPEPVILVVDDEPRVLVRCKAILERASYIFALKQGVNSLILKPFSEPDLIQTIQGCLEDNEHRRDVLQLRALRHFKHCGRTWPGGRLLHHFT